LLTRSWSHYTNVRVWGQSVPLTLSGLTQRMSYSSEKSHESCFQKEKKKKRKSVMWVRKSTDTWKTWLFILKAFFFYSSGSGVPFQDTIPYTILIPPLWLPHNPLSQPCLTPPYSISHATPRIQSSSSDFHDFSNCNPSLKYP